MLKKLFLPKLVHKKLEAIDEFIGKEICGKTAKAKSMPDMNSRNAEEIVNPSVKREEILNEFGHLL